MLSDTDFFANIQLIAETMPSYSCLEIFCHGALNFTKSLNRQLFIDGAFPTETPAQEGALRAEKNYGVSLGIPLEYRLNYSNTRIIGRYDVNSGNKVWYPFRTVAMANDYPIKSYSSTLEHFGLFDEEMSPDNFAENFYKLSNVMVYDYGFFAFLRCTNINCPNFLDALIKRLRDDGIDYNLTTIKPEIEIIMLISRCGGVRAQTKIEIMIDAVAATHGNETLRDITIIGYANRDGDSMRLYPFKEVATSDYGVITPMNGWESPGSTPVAVRSGRYVDLNFGFENGIVTNGTVIGKVPEGFRPCETRTIPVIADAHAEYARLVVYTNGDIKLFGANEATKKIVGTGGYMI